MRTGICVKSRWHLTQKVDAITRILDEASLPKLVRNTFRV